MTLGFKLDKRIIFALVLAACQPSKRGSQGDCSGVQAAVSDESAIVNTSPALPAGGFVHVGSRACTATFLLNKVTDSGLELSAYTAQHCFRENTLENEDVGISVHIPSGDGYLKNLKAADDFLTRRSTFLSEVNKLSSNAASDMARRAMQIQLFAERGLERFSPDASESEIAAASTNDDFQRNVCISSRTDRLTVPESQEVCWSTFDTTVRTLSLSAVQIGAAQFAKLKNHLEKRRQAHDAMMSSSVQIATYFNKWNTNLHGQQGAWRLLSYIELSSFLNSEVCGRYLSKSDPNQSICGVRDKLKELVGKYLIEVDVDGKKKSILEQAQELGFGIDSPFLRVIPGTSITSKMNDIFEPKASESFYNFMNQRIATLREMFPTKNQKIMALPKQFSVAANSVIANHTNAISFALIDSSALVSESEPIPSPGIQTLGTLRMYLSKKSSKVSFGHTDSGAMLTFAGIIPLLVVNSVDDKPTSGGTAILALPEINDEDSPVSDRRISSRKNTAQIVSSDTRVVDNTALVAENSISCR